MLDFIFSKKRLYTIITCMLSIQVMAYDYNDQPNNMLLDRIDKLEHDLITIQKHLYSRSGTKQGMNPDDNIVASIENRIDIVEEQMRTIVGQMEQLEHNINTLAKKLDQSIANNKTSEQNISMENQKISPEENNSLGIVSTKLIEDVKRNNSSFDDTMEEDFKKAFTLLKTAKKDESIRYFKQFIKNYPNTDLTPEAYYWLGEIYFSKKDFENASINFLRNYKLSPHGEKTVDSMLKLSISLKNLQRVKDACLILNKLSKDFPDQSTDIKNKTLQLNKELNCQ
ncbi:Tol system periplasmic component TolR [Rickettsiales bacterium Ac37b]|nr:Tol system periplasmic component TolR [Rickettsiales bacterium Ac37b]